MLSRLCDGVPSKLTCAMLGVAAEKGDAFALTELDSWARSYSIALSNFITLFSPERVAIGGGVANIGEPLIEPVRKYTDGLDWLRKRTL